MSDTIKCRCQNCGAKYRLAIESQGRKARCKKCGAIFAVPRLQSATVEDSILGWLDEPESDDDTVERPRIISMPKEAADPEAAKKIRGMIRIKEDSVETAEK